MERLKAIRCVQIAALPDPGSEVWQYFECKPNLGVFVKQSQVKKLTGSDSDAAAPATTADDAVDSKTI